MCLKEYKVEPNPNEEKKPQQITKLAIGKPGGADFSDEKWEQSIEIKCLKCNKTLPSSSQSQKIKDLIQSILMSSSENEKSGIKAWEEEIFPCEHTLTLHQNEGIKIAEKSIAKCNDCDLSSNLWLCLTCGNLSCGRKETGGNQHAIEHYKKTSHPLVVKTGTITPNGEASLYCYACDNDVKDENLAEHLKAMGIDIATQKKTDKTVTEMNLDININFTLSKTIEEGKVLIPLYGPGNTGLENIGNSCYMNSVIQILFNIEQFKKWYFDSALEHLNTCYKNPAECFLCQMSKIMYGLHSGMYSMKKTKKLPTNENEIEEYQDGIKPSSFKYFFGKDHPEFSTNHQQDAYEYLNHLLEKMKHFDKNRNINPLELFEFEIERRIECCKCHSVKYRKTKNWSLNLNVVNWKECKDENSKISIDDCINKFLGEEILNDISCPNCKEKTNWISTQKILNFPKYLILVFERFVFNDWVPVKLEVQLDLKLLDFDLKVFCRDHSKPNEKVIESGTDELNDLEEEKEPEFKQDDINFLLQCGIPELGAKWALFKNNNNPDLAMGWYCENVDNPEIKQPLPKIKVKKNQKNQNFSDDNVNSLVSMGFTKEKSIIALKKTNGNVDAAVDFLFSHPEDIVDDDVDDKENDENKEINKGNGSLYDIYGYITHLGKNATHGHYVCHIRKKDNVWTYFNDLRVNEWENPPVYKGFIYFFKNKSVSENDNK